MSVQAEVPVLEEEGISYVFVNEFSAQNDDDQNRPIYIGTKRFGGLYCCACERPLGLSDEKQNRVSRAVRKADKNDNNIVAKCVQCNATIEDQKIIVPCSSFDWHLPPHVLERLLRYEKALQTKKSEKKKQEANDEDSDSDSADEPIKKKKSHKEAIAVQKSSTKSVNRLPQLSRKGHIEDQYGHVISLQDFFSIIVAPCHVRLYDRTPKHFV